MRKLKVILQPSGTIWKWQVYAWLDADDSTRAVEGGPGYYEAWLIAPHPLGEFFGGSARTEAKAIKAARTALGEVAANLAVQEFDKARGRAAGLDVEIGGEA